MRYARPQHFLPVHGEYAFLCAHAQVRPGELAGRAGAWADGMVGNLLCSVGWG